MLPSSLPRGLRAAIGAVLSAAVLGAASYASVRPLRVKVVRTSDPPVSAAVGALDLVLPDVVAALRAPAALILHAGNSGTSPVHLTIALDNTDVCRATVAPTGTGSSRVDCAVMSIAGTPRVLSLRGDNRAWRITDLELATHFGRSTGLGDYYLLPRGSTMATPLPWLWALIGGVVVGLLLWRQPTGVPRAVHWFSIVAGIVGGAIAVAALAAPLVSGDAILMSPGTVVGWALAAAAPVAWAALAWSARAVDRQRRAHAAATTWGVSVAVGLVVFACLWTPVARGLRDHDHNYSAFAHIAKVFIDGNPDLADNAAVRDSLVIEHPGGYDGQFMYFAAFDPLVRRHAAQPDVYGRYIDNPPYRLSRIGFVWLTDLVSFGRWQAFPAAMVWITLVAAVVAAIVIAREAQRQGRSPLWGLLPLGVHGVWQSVQSALPEAVVMALVVSASLLVLRRRYGAASVAFALALLTRETTTILVLAALVFALRERNMRGAAFLAAAFVPLAAWRLYLGSVLFPAYGVNGFLGASPVVGLPFAGIAELWRHVARGDYLAEDPTMARAAIWFPLLAIAGAALAWVLAIRRPSSVTVAAAAYGLLAVSFNYHSVWVHVGNGQRTSFELFMLLAVATVAAPALHVSGLLRRALDVFWGLTVAYLLLGSYDAWSMREAAPWLVIAGIIAALAAYERRQLTPAAG